MSTPAVVYDLFDRLPAGGHELVLFDINRAVGRATPSPAQAPCSRVWSSAGARRYTVTLVTNTTTDTPAVSAITVAAGSTSLSSEPLGLEWPRDMFSLSHVALPFPPRRSALRRRKRGREETEACARPRRTRGEKDVLVVPIDALMRVSWNPFFSYMAAPRIEQ